MMNLVSHKIVTESQILKRTYHADVFMVGVAPAVLVVCFGGSGISRQVYEQRQATIVSVFDRALGCFARERSFGFAFVTAPYDVPFNSFGTDEADAVEWNTHVEEELLPAVKDTLQHGLEALPMYLIGYSGGAALALNGAHENERCVGVGALGADGLPREFDEGPSWQEPLRLYYNTGDRVFDPNRETVMDLVEAGVAVLFRKLPGGHALEDYVRNESFGGLIRRACMLASRQV